MKELTLNDKLALLLDYMPKDKWNFKHYVELKYKYPYHVLSNDNIQEAITNFCLENDLCEECLDKPYCNCTGERIPFKQPV